MYQSSIYSNCDFFWTIYLTVCTVHEEIHRVLYKYFCILIWQIYFVLSSQCSCYHLNTRCDKNMNCSTTFNMLIYTSVIVCKCLSEDLCILQLGSFAVLSFAQRPIDINDASAFVMEFKNKYSNLS